MRTRLLMAARLCFALFLLQLLSCNKLDLKDLLHHPDKVPQLCDIEKISYLDYSGDTASGVFTYNYRGDPVKVIFNHPATGRPHLTFRYNKQGRLTDYIGPYNEGPNSYFEFWYRYQYDAQGKKIIGDSSFAMGAIVNNELVPYDQQTTVATYEYDSLGRVSKTVRRWVNIPQLSLQTFIYSYDNKGNLAVKRWYQGDNIENETFYTYGDKPSLYRTNKVWMIVDYDYSVNNSLQALSYNKYGLPLKTGMNTGAPYYFLYQIQLSQASFVYSCK